MKRFLAALMLLLVAVSAASAQQILGAQIYSGGAWIPAPSSSTSNPLATVSTVRMYCYSASLGAWVPADSSCFGGGAAPQNVASSPAYAPTKYVALGDSITSCGTGLTFAANCYPNHLGFDMDVTPTNRAVSGDQAADVIWRVQSGDNPTVAGAPTLYSLMVGTNDAEVNGVGSTTWEANFKLFHTAVLAWLGIPSSGIVAGSTGTVTGTCANDTTFAAMTGKACTANASTITFASVATTGGPLYVFYRSISSDAGTWTYAVDGAAPVAVATAPPITFSTANGHTSSMGYVRVTGLSAGTHSVVFTQTNSGTMSILALGSLPTLAYTSLPHILALDVPNQLDGNKLSTTQAYSADADADIALLAGDNLNIALAPVNTVLQATTAAGDMFNTLHPADLGHLEIYRAVRATMKQVTTYPMPGNYSQASQQWTLNLNQLYLQPFNVSDFNLNIHANGSHSSYISLYSGGTSNQMAVNFLAGATSEWGLGWFGLGTAASDFEFYDYVGGHSVVEFAQNMPAHSFRVDSTGAPVVPLLKSTTGTRFVCADTTGKLVSSTTACSGT